MFQDLRRAKILELLRENGSTRVRELSKLFDVTEPTIRQDLETLEKTGAIKRQHGGAYINNYSTFAAQLSLEHREHMNEKRAIGEKAASFVKSGDNIIIDSGSTLTEMARFLGNRKNLSIVTTALNITLLLAEEPSNNIILTGGEFKAPTLSLTGNKAAAIFENLYVEKLFLATGGFSLQAGLTYPGFSDLHLKRAMIDSAKTVYLLVDSSKLEKVLFASLGSQSKIDFLLTDKNADPEYIKQIEDIGIKVLVC